MPLLTGRRILVAVTGGVAAYKAAVLCRLLIEEGASVRVVMTEEATNFIGATTFASITNQPVLRDLFEADLVSPHTELGRWAELVIVAPATAATMARMAAGLSEEAVSTSVLATRAPVLIAPAMHTEMWEHPATQRNLRQLLADGHQIVGPESGPLAGGDTGVGRMAEPEQILEAAVAAFPSDLRGRRVLVTAGGTREAIDPVRYIGNRSSGKMGHALATEAARRGAEVTLVTTSDLAADPRVKVVPVESAQQMAEAVGAVEADIAVMAAAVADFRPADASTTKLARGDGPPDITLEPTPDILASVARRSPRPFLVGFAAEAGDLTRAVEKARGKGVDLLVANDITEEGAGFGVDTNRVTIITPEGDLSPWELMPKAEVARRLWDLIVERLTANG
ncbi:MAG TPA: bifunctional phosphopantothenoylcysteine decarboxylase/phosphopantothenate--cysteine ligase CoaBC [Acidimicrobiia bacterium]|nr:bifunctional phosphopantothenoylcysteine decarboxylase/phosphopantothenate--cysteine ligase CoaBC [Acidimicrobiia bacterium]